jgi:hypothetical protein
MVKGASRWKVVHIELDTTQGELAQVCRCHDHVPQLPARYRTLTIDTSARCTPGTAGKYFIHMYHPTLHYIHVLNLNIPVPGSLVLLSNLALI